MIGKVVRGNDIGGLLRYLFGPGRANEHTNPHVVAAWDDGVVADHTSGSDPRLKRLTALLGQPLAALDDRPSPAVWHCPLRTAPGDRQLTDAEWADVAAEVLHQTGLAPRGDTAGCRWIAVRHADDHIHLAVTLARQDGRRARTSHDYAKLGAACRTVELRYGLKVTPARDRTAPKRPTRAEIEKAARQGLPETTRQFLRREVRRAALSSRSLQGFIRHLEVAQVQVRLRHSTINFDEVTGYSVALIDATGDCPGPWFGGGMLAPQLTLPRLQHLWSANTAGASSDMRNRRTLGSPVARTLRSTAVVLHQLEDGNFHGAALAMAIDTVRELGGRSR